MRSKPAIAFFLAFAAFVAVPAEAQSIGLGAGIVDLEQDDKTPLFLTANFRVRLFGPITLEPEVGYWKRTEQVAAGELSFEDFSVGANALLVIPGSKLEFFAGVGLGAHFLDRTAGIAGIIRDANDTDVAVHLLGGLDLKVSSSVSLFAAARHDSFGDDTDARDQTKFYGGLRFRF